MSRGRTKDPGLREAPPGGLLPRLHASFLEHLRLERGLSPNTCAAYEGDIRRFLESLPGRLLSAPGEIAEKQVFDFIVAERRRGRDVASVRRSLSALRTFFRFVIRERAHSANPAREIENPRSWVRLPSYLRVEEVKRLISAVTEETSRYPLRDAALLELVYATGLRVGEVTSLRVDSVRPDLRILRCLGKGSRERIVPVSRSALQALALYTEKERPRLVRGTSTDLLFVSRAGKPLGREVVRAFLRKYALAAGIAGRLTPHTLRHSFATHMVQNGADLRIVQEILGHVKVETTEIYTHLSKHDLKAAHRKFHPRG
jgi:integrase/recombinase XerD